MKILFENWRKFALVESEEQSLGSLEKKYLGLDSNTITQIGNDLVDMRHRPFALIKLHMHKYGIDLKKPQSGAFRTTYQITDNIVIKIAHDTNKDHGFKMNGEDYLLATEGGIGSIFPKYYGSPGGCEGGCSWIAMEKVTPMTLMGDISISEFFPSTLLKEPRSYNENSVYTYIISACISRKPMYDWIEEEALKMLNQDREDKFASVPYDKLYYDFKYNSKNFQYLVDLVKKYPRVRPDELLAHPNCGIGSDGRFVVLDSSFFG